jgi:general secretion pathway protein G
VNNRRKLIRRKQRGMTLLEIIVVVAILSLMMGGAVFALMPALKQAKVDQARMDINVIEQALKAHYIKKGKYPDSGNLQSLVTEQYLDKLPQDPWNADYVYMLEGGKPIVMSYGEDNTTGGDGYAADLKNTDTKPAGK